jgi:hypothetical protein
MAEETPGQLAGVRQGHLDRQIDPAGAGSQGRLQQVGTVAGEQEDHVGVVAEPVHLVEQLEQQRSAAGRLTVTVLGNEVDVLSDLPLANAIIRESPARSIPYIPMRLFATERGPAR